MKICPYCAEEIQDAAIKCKHCMEFLDGSARPPPPPVDSTFKWYFRKAFITSAICTVGPFALPLIWFRPKTSLAWKIVLSIVILAVSVVLYKVAVYCINNIIENYKMLGDVLNGSFVQNTSHKPEL